MIKCSLDTRAFDKAMSEYMTFNKRLPADLVNSTLYFIARNATQTTKSSNSSRIRSELEGPGKLGGVLGALIVNSKLGKHGMPGVNGAKMKREVEKLIKNRIKSINFIRSGWKNAINIIETYLRSKGEFNFVRRNNHSNLQPDKATMKKQVSADSGTAIVARIDRGPRVWGEIQNNVFGDGKENLGNIKIAGLQAAINKEEQSKRVYIERKINEAHARLNR